MNRAGKNWNEQEIDYLNESWGNTSIPTIAANLGRSVSSIMNKAIDEGLRSHLHSGEYLTLSQVWFALYGYTINTKTVKRLKLHKFPITTHRVTTKSFRMVDVNAFWKWLEKHPHMLSIANLKPGDLGVEPEWVAERRIADKKKQSLRKKYREKWTRQEDERLRILVAQKRYTYEELGKLMMRTSSAIRRRTNQLNLKNTVHKKRAPWTQQESDRAKDLYERGYSCDHIGEILGRDGNSIHTKFYREQFQGRNKQMHRKETMRHAENKVLLEDRKVDLPAPVRSEQPAEMAQAHA